MTFIFYGIILPIDFHIFPDGWNHQPFIELVMVEQTLQPLYAIPPRASHQGGAEGQLAAHPAAAQFLLDNAANVERGPHALPVFPQSSFKGIWGHSTWFKYLNSNYLLEIW